MNDKPRECDEQHEGDREEPDSKVSGLRIRTNISSLHKPFELQRTTDSLSTSLERLSAGLKINRGGDEPDDTAEALEPPPQSISYDQQGRRRSTSLDDDAFAADI